ncbi:sulfite oxidase mitochondrial precursor [Fomitopsis serialis]|uniref:sulfite oxidase mitochondrial precursor n=1 Tax=Fomitopsis serialis TaxID=139415 RepID=UPI002008012A|nr:sulfite oxidase mitochondrial precursor [Neoantrodia serialis]KAH9936496.1 sulfite oxidase mitochondrial precursor [Neoantrodia serialis]
MSFGTMTMAAFEGVPLSQLFPEEKLGWNGYVEWEDKPDRKEIARRILATKEFTPSPEFQLEPLPKTNPVLIGYRWKEYHEALGLQRIVDFSWETVQKEKPDMIHLLDFPYNGETPRKPLMEGKITDNKYHFVRNHGGIPDIDEDAFELEIGGLVNTPVKLTMKDLKDASRFPQKEVTVTLQCSGTRRIEQIQEYPGEGDELIQAPWGEGAMYALHTSHPEHIADMHTGVQWNSRLPGVTLKKVLKVACGGLKSEARHLEFLGADTYFKKGNVFNYAVSVSSRKVRNQGGEEVLLAWEMNGKPLPKIHGFPLRVVVTGVIGARSTKWLYKINAIEEPSLGPVQSQEYLYYNIQIGKHNSKYSNGFSIQNMPVSSAIIFPQDKEVIIHDGHVELSGWAYSGGGNWPERVEVSPDGGHVWYAVDPADMTEKHYHAWRLWKISVPVNAEGWIEFCARTWDSSCNTEPTFVRSAWNWDLHVTSSCHRIKLYSINRTKPETKARLEQYAARGESMTPITKTTKYGLENMDEYLAKMRTFPGSRGPRTECLGSSLGGDAA